MAFRPFPAIPNRGRHIRERALADDAEFVTGAVVTSADGEVDEAGANPALILGFAAEPTNYPGGQDFNPGRRLIFTAEANSTFWVTGGEDDDGLVEVEPLEEHIDNIYGLTKDPTSGIWYLDLDKDAANQRALVEDIDQSRNLFEIRIPEEFRVLK